MPSQVILNPGCCFTSSSHHRKKHHVWQAISEMTNFDLKIFPWIHQLSWTLSRVLFAEKGWLNDRLDLLLIALALACCALVGLLILSGIDEYV